MNQNHSANLALDKITIRKSFDNLAENYEQYAIHQKDIAAHLVNRLEYIQHHPDTILDLGSGTGFVIDVLKKKFPKAKIIALDISISMLKKLKNKHDGWFSKALVICADAEKLPFKTGQFDLIISSLCFPWCFDINTLFSDIYRTLKPEGLLLFSSLGTDTLKELKEASLGSAINLQDQFMPFYDMHDIGDTLINNGFYLPVMDAERSIDYFTDLSSLLGKLDTMNISYANFSQQGFDATEAKYQQLLSEQGLPLTLETTYGIGWKKPIATFPPNQVLPFSSRR